MGLLLATGPARSAPSAAPVPDTCLPALAAVERTSPIPRALLQAIAVVESGRLDPITKIPAPWAWTVTADGTGRSFASKAMAVEATQALLAAGTKSVDVGCMQINLAHHPDAFASLDQAFDPDSNVAYASRFLRVLFGRTGTWPKAVAAYHSQTPDVGADYERRVMALWPLAPAFADPPVDKDRPGLVPDDRLPGFTAWASRNACEATRLGAERTRAAPVHLAAAPANCAARPAPPPCFICQGMAPLR